LRSHSRLGTVASAIASSPSDHRNPRMTRWPPPHHLASYTTLSDANLAELVIRHLELSGFTIDEEHQVLRKRPPTPNHG
jgi:hypothetical protein